MSELTYLKLPVLLRSELPKTCITTIQVKVYLAGVDKTYGENPLHHYLELFFHLVLSVVCGSSTSPGEIKQPWLLGSHGFQGVSGGHKLGQPKS